MRSSAGATSATNDRDWADLFRRKSFLADLLSRHLDDLEEPRAKAYMTCRPVPAAKIDFDCSSDDAKEASNGYGSSQHMAIEQLERQAGIDVIHAPKPGTAVHDVAGGGVGGGLRAGGRA
jgi:hypothetical protein